MYDLPLKKRLGLDSQFCIPLVPHTSLLGPPKQQFHFLLNQGKDYSHKLQWDWSTWCCCFFCSSTDEACMLTLANKLHVADPKKVKIWSKENNKQDNIEVDKTPEKNTRITSLIVAIRHCIFITFWSSMYQGICLAMELSTISTFLNSRFRKKQVDISLQLQRKMAWKAHDRLAQVKPRTTNGLNDYVVLEMRRLPGKWNWKWMYLAQVQQVEWNSLGPHILYQWGS